MLGEPGSRTTDLVLDKPPSVGLAFRVSINSEASRDLIMRYYLRIKQEFLDLILSGKKRVEVRVNDSRFQNLSRGAILSFNGRHQVEVAAVRHYHSFEELLLAEGVANVAPGMTLDAALTRLREFYPPDREAKGALAIEILKASDATHRYQQNGQCSDLLSLSGDIDSCSFCRSNEQFANDGLRHIVGGGCEDGPNLMLVLMNPTARNPTLAQDYCGERVSYAGVASFWRVLIKAGLLESSLLRAFDKQPWSDQKTQVLLDALAASSIYVTELVKCPSRTAVTPDAATIAHNLKFLKEELRIVRPKAVVALGHLVFEALTGRRIKLGEVVARPGTPPATFQLREELEATAAVFPCYFPTGRGNHAKATQVLLTLGSARPEYQ